VSLANELIAERREAGGGVVEAALPCAPLSTVNLVEIVTKLID
jgi:PIN domain nuclease of toxin-antitoxin system